MTYIIFRYKRISMVQSAAYVQLHLKLSIIFLRYKYNFPFDDLEDYLLSSFTSTETKILACNHKNIVKFP